MSPRARRSAPRARGAAKPRVAARAAIAAVLAVVLILAIALSVARALGASPYPGTPPDGGQLVYSVASSSRSTFFSTLPMALRGRSSTTTTAFGTL